MLRVAVLGAGTAGLSCAVALRRNGHEVFVYERFPALEPVGAGMLIQPSGVKALHRLGVGADFERVSVPVRHLKGHSHRGWLLVDVPYPTAPARGSSRPNMTRVLAGAAVAAGARLRMAQEVTAIHCGVDVAEVASHGSTERFDVIVIANGSGSTLAQQCGLAAPSTVYPWGALNGMFEVEHWDSFDVLQQRMRGPRQLMGLMPTACNAHSVTLSFFWSLPVADYPAWQAADLAPWREELLGLWPEAHPVVDQIRTHDSLSFATYRHAWPQRLSGPRVCIVGDAAHAMSPQLGLGSTLAVGDALALGLCLQGHDVAAELAAYERMRKRRVKRSQVLSRLLTPCFQADLPAWWRDALFGVGLKLPGVTRLMQWSLEG